MPVRERETSVLNALRAVLSAATLLIAIFPLARYVQTALLRLDYPFDLEWTEGGMIGHIRVVLAGQSLYREPSLEFTPYIYPPLYYYVSAIPSLLLGTEHLAARLVSFVSILGSFVLLGRWVRDETGDPVAGMAAVGMFAATYPLTGYWFELIRLDSFFLVLVLGAHTVARKATTTLGAAGAGVLIAAAVFTKQLGIPLAIPTIVACAKSSPRRGVVCAVVSGSLVLFGAVVLDASTSGWFHYYVLDLPSRHHIEWERFWPSLQRYFLGASFPMTLGGLALLCGVGFRPYAWRRWLSAGLFVAVACASSFLPFLKSGGYPNGLIPAYASLALASGIVVGALRSAKPASPLGRIRFELAACLLLICQFGALDYDRRDALPTADDLTANHTVMARLRELARPIYVTGPSYYTMTAGDNPIMADTMALADIFKGGGAEAERLGEALALAVRQHRFKTLVLDRVAGFLPGNLVDQIHGDYVRTGSVLDGLPADVIWPKSGASLRPDEIWVPR